MLPCLEPNKVATEKSTTENPKEHQLFENAAREEPVKLDEFCHNVLLPEQTSYSSNEISNSQPTKTSNYLQNADFLRTDQQAKEILRNQSESPMEEDSAETRVCPRYEVFC